MGMLIRIFLASVLISLQIGSAGAATGAPNPQEFISLLKDKKYEALDARLTSYQKAFEADFRQEKDVQLAFLSFHRTDPSLEVYLSEWIAQSPRSYAAHLARGMYYSAVAFKKRGIQVASETTEGKFSGMQLYLSKAQEDLMAAIKINPQLMPAYSVMIFIPMAFGLKDQTKTIIDEALKQNPYSFSARWSYLVSLEPKWGGSYRAMEEFLQQARPYFSENPYLKVLNGRVFAAHGDHAKAWSTTLFYYDKALAHGEHPYYYLRRGESLYHLQRYQEAIDPLDKALQLRPGYPDALKMRGLSHWGAGNYDKSLEDLNAAVATDPTDHKLIYAKGRLHEHFKKYKSAVEDYEKAIELSPTNAKYRESRKRVQQAIEQSR